MLQVTLPKVTEKYWENINITNSIFWGKIRILQNAMDIYYKNTEILLKWALGVCQMLQK